ncbi:FHA domain-containing protein [Saccharothrix variisporea]|uniref:FHA domain-containing protein n=1 Tax=Saccharothrix variisporea TaxID=543527 RepID=A0A495XFJ6_9PSEU|nr:FHA domain-containing protein [Saccharothrix variisporea]RKT72767.1 FHA domain-containing protein [Saccharothrix variisporea]
MAARLVVVRPASLKGAAFVVAAERAVVGRAGGVDIRIPDRSVSSCHAALVRRGGRVVVEDLGSTNGTAVNGSTVSVARPLRHGDVVGFGGVELRFEESYDGTATGLYEPVREPRGAHFEIPEQRADVINNVGRDQYVLQQRDGFLREIAATRTRATRLIWIGAAMIVGGGAVFAAMILRTMSDLGEALDLPAEPGVMPDFQFDFMGPRVGGMPVGLIGWAVCGIGNVLLIAGIVLHVVATARKRKVDARFPVRHH